jgi:hypothetical protein
VEQAHHQTVGKPPLLPASFNMAAATTEAKKELLDAARSSPPSMPVGPDGPQRQVINTTKFSLAYQIEQQGPSGVGKVEAWITRDRGQSWQRLCDDPDRQSPVQLELPGEGLFGVSLVVCNGRGFGGTTPAQGDAPDWWIEVDLSSPVAELVAVRPNTGDDPLGMVITWNARDKNFGPEPIDLYYAVNRDGPWMVIAKGLRNEGRYRWTVPQQVGPQAFIRLVATDRAGNRVQCDTPHPVALDDLSRPRARVVGVSGSNLP